MKRNAVLLATIVTLFAIRAFAQTSWDLYEPRTLKEITTTIAEKSLKNPDVVRTDPQKNPSIILSYNSHQSRVKVVYTGESRKVAEKKKEVIRFWLATLGKSKELLELFQTEYRFTENNVDHWLPVQRGLIEHFPKELKKGETVTLFVAWLGGRYESKGFDNVFLVNEFEKDLR